MYCFEIGDAQKSLLFQLKDAFTMKIYYSQEFGHILRGQ